MKKGLERYVKCEIGLGMFKTERAFLISTKEESYSGFTDKKNVIATEEFNLTDPDKHIPGKIKVYAIEEIGDKIRVYLPGDTLNGPSALIPKEMFVD